jgi:hypothetical protein
VARRIGVDERRDEPAVADRRWLLISVSVFAAALATFALVVWLFHLTGPHPQVWVLIRRLRTFARWLLPRWSHHWHPN